MNFSTAKVIASEELSDLDGFIMEVGRSFDSHVIFRVVKCEQKRTLLIKVFPNQAVNQEGSDAKSYRVALSNEELSDFLNYLDALSVIPTSDNYEVIDGSTWTYKFENEGQIWRYHSPFTKSSQRELEPLVNFANFLWKIADRNKIDLGEAY
ncbi:hypothetical protein [Microbulbifer sp. JTAC008]|uniref:hypothetical protein n=1 Tax=unclassified Microbulbifer TaxID=2619833 RepID=UPI00403A094C